MKTKKQLTTKEKLEAYKYALYRLRKQDIMTIGICHYLDNWICRIINIKTQSLKETLQYFPEFMKHQGGHSSSSLWWELNKKGIKIRIKVLEKIIKELEKATSCVK